MSGMEDTNDEGTKVMKRRPKVTTVPTRRLNAIPYDLLSGNNFL